MSTLRLKIDDIGHNKNPRLVLLHGWASHASIWQAFIKQFSQKYYIYNVYLPGHGCEYQHSFSLTTMTQALNQQLPPAMYLGWSLGGSISLAMALNYPQKVQSLILLATTPKFVAEQNQAESMPLQLWQNFKQELNTKPKALLNKFYYLQSNRRQHIKQLKQQFATIQFEQSALKDGLSILETSDFRRQLVNIQCPSLWFFAGQDQLVPIAMADKLLEYQTKATIIKLEDAGHVMILSHLEQILNHL